MSAPPNISGRKNPIQKALTCQRTPKIMRHILLLASGLWSLPSASAKTTAPHGHVTPFLLTSPTGYTLYFAAASPRWNQNSLMRIGLPLPQAH